MKSSRRHFRYGYQSMVTPLSVYDYDMNSRGQTLLKQTEVPNYDPASMWRRGSRTAKDA